MSFTTQQTHINFLFKVILCLGLIFSGVSTSYADDAASAKENYDNAIAACEQMESPVPQCNREEVLIPQCKERAALAFNHGQIAEKKLTALEKAMDKMKGCLGNMFPGWNFNFSIPSLDDIIGNIASAACDAAQAEVQKNVGSFSGAMSYDLGKQLGVPAGIIPPASAGTYGGTGVPTGYNGTMNGGTYSKDATPPVFENAKSYLSR